MVEDKEKRLARQKRYKDKVIKKVFLEFNRNTDTEVIAWIEQQKNVQGAIRELIIEKINCVLRDFD